MRDFDAAERERLGLAEAERLDGYDEWDCPWDDDWLADGAGLETPPLRVPLAELARSL